MMRSKIALFRYREGIELIHKHCDAISLPIADLQELIGLVVDAKRNTRRHGLFAGFDDILSREYTKQEASERDVAWLLDRDSHVSHTVREGVWLREVELRDFKAYQFAKIELPKPSRNQNVILIGGLNGYGKTTLFEAVTLGLFGPHNLWFLARAKPGDEATQQVSYRQFMERILYAGAVKQGRTSCSVKLTFEEAGGHPCIILRRWHYSDDGKFQPGQDEIRILYGPERKPLEPPSSVADPDKWYFDWIRENIVRLEYAHFFMFDGEYVSIYAENDRKTQVKRSIEELLGVVWLRELKEALEDYRKQRSSQALCDVDERLQSIEKSA